METNNTNNGTENTGLKSERPISEKKHVYNFALNSFSIESSNHFNKIHKRRFHSFGCGHEPGTIPGGL